MSDCHLNPNPNHNTYHQAATRNLREIPYSPGIDSNGETVKTLSGPIFPDRQETEMEITTRLSIHPSSSTDPQPHNLSFTCYATYVCSMKCMTSYVLLCRLIVNNEWGPPNLHSSQKLFSLGRGLVYKRPILQSANHLRYDD